MHCMESILSTPEERLACTVNPIAGREKNCRIIPTQEPKKVIVVGGGPGGMEVARVAALRGHKVALYEKRDALGGQLLSAVVPPEKDRIRPLIEYLVDQVEMLSVDVNLRTEFTPEIAEKEKPDVVVLATGVNPFVPQIPGIDRSNVYNARMFYKAKQRRVNVLLL